MDKQEHPIIELQCYEPSGESIPISERDLLGHTLIIGGTGAGKTTRVINPILKQMIEHKASSREGKVGLCILDSKADGEAQALLQKLCREAGRAQDLIVVDGTNSLGIDLFEPIREHGLEGVDAIAGILCQLIPNCEANRYWEITMASLIRQILRIMILSDDDLTYRRFIELSTEYLLGYRFREPTVEMINELKAIDESNRSSSIDYAISDTLATHRMWTVLDSRTRSNLQSMAAPIVDALSSAKLERLLGCESSFNIADIGKHGRIALVSIDAIRHPEAAALLGAVIKARFYDSILARGHSKHQQHRLSGLVLDDWPLCATGGIDRRYSDVSALSILRSRRGFLIAATQSLAALDIKMGQLSRTASVANFANLFLMRSRELETDTLAAAYLGETKRILIDRSIHDSSNSHRKPTTARFEREQRVPTVPLGTLASLPIGESFAIIGDRKYDLPHSLVPELTPDNQMEEGHEQTH